MKFFRKFTKNKTKSYCAKPLNFVHWYFLYVKRVRIASADEYLHECFDSIRKTMCKQ